VFAKCISYLFIAVTKITDRNNLKEDRFILAHSFRGVTVLFWGRKWQSRGGHFVATRKQRGGAGRDQEKYRPQRNVFGDLSSNWAQLLLFTTCRDAIIL
jgi:hypothetical protein